MTPADIIQYIDLTSLNDDDTEEKISALCQKAITFIPKAFQDTARRERGRGAECTNQYMSTEASSQQSRNLKGEGYVAAVCIYPQFISAAWKNLIESPIKIATVANFPSGNHSREEITAVIKNAILDGASEIDVVIPQENIGSFIAYCKILCGDKALLKVILETGALSDHQIQDYSEIAIEHGADFLKTSTGKIPQGATISAATIMLETIKNSKKPVGLKVSGGIKTVKNAITYIDLFNQILGVNHTQSISSCSVHLSPQRFRIGASTLLEDILLCISKNRN